MNIQLTSTKAISIDLEPLDINSNEKIDNDNLDDETSFSFDFNPLLEGDDGKTDCFLVAFFGEMKSLKEKYECRVIYIARFQVDELISIDFLKENFALINAPAIGYPYFRSFYSNLLLNAGYEPKILPTINFVKLREDKLNEMRNDFNA